MSRPPGHFPLPLALSPLAFLAAADCARGANVHPPGSENFEHTAIAWLLDIVPPEYRSYGILRRHPAALASMARP
jgi:hypothetical protein